MKPYNNPPIGCYLEQHNYNNEEISAEICKIAIGYGWEPLPDDLHFIETCGCDDEERSNGPRQDVSEELHELSEEAIEFLNEQEKRSYLWWGNDGKCGAFGLFANAAAEDCGFVSQKSHADARFAHIETDPDDADYPPADYRGEWLHVNDHGNCTLYVRGDDGKDTEIWSVV